MTIIFIEEIDRFGRMMYHFNYKIKNFKLGWRGREVEVVGGGGTT